jgi:hypothetical protein
MSNFDFICERYEFPHNFFSTYNTSNSDVSSHKVQNVMMCPILGFEIFDLKKFLVQSLDLICQLIKMKIK